MEEVKIPYYIYNNIIFSKKISCNLSKHYKIITYVYDIYNKEGISEKEVKHRTNNLPAIIIYRNNIISELQYFYHGKKHREYGAAIIKLNSKHEITEELWYKDDKKLKETEIQEIKLLVDRRKKMLKLISKMKSRNIS